MADRAAPVLREQSTRCIPSPEDHMKALGTSVKGGTAATSPARADRRGSRLRFSTLLYRRSSPLINACPRSSRYAESLMKALGTWTNRNRTATSSARAVARH
ncbi:hypothetical protein BGAL_0145g00210 [Botrytis galanthina]|uniref:Uncharacterized protein n=1 Tax=Botrytis galanthina TaxID=278940 RepID=A0A4S8RB13_9HELO|nr:hypothetical protein BGAL_0145g00210 [Botrytis galanthina]